MTVGLNVFKKKNRANFFSFLLLMRFSQTDGVEQEPQTGTKCIFKIPLSNQHSFLCLKIHKMLNLDGCCHVTSSVAV